MRYQVIVGNIGQVEHTNDWMIALKVFNSYVTQSLTGTGCSAGENVTLMNGDNVMPEYDFDFWMHLTSACQAGRAVNQPVITNPTT